jgi:hypothetical protein
VKTPYDLVDPEAAAVVGTVEEFARENGQVLLPPVELVKQADLAVDEVIDRIGRHTPSKTILNLSAEQIAGPRTPGKSSGIFAGTDRRTAGSVLPTGRSKVNRLPLRHKENRELSVPAYQSLLDNDTTAQRTMDTLLRVFPHANTPRCCRKWQKRQACHVAG